MGYPTDTDWPGALDAAETRINGDVIDSDDFNYQDKQGRKLQSFLGTTGQLIGSGIVAQGPGGLLSPIASGASNIAHKLLARASFAAGKLLSVGDDYDSAPPAYTEKMSLTYQGVLWVLGGLQIASTQQVSAILDEDDLVSDSDTALATQQSIKAYIDSAADVSSVTRIVGNSAAGDTAADCDYLDTGNGAQLQAALTAAATADDDVFIRRGTYDLGSGGAPTKFTVPVGVRVIGAGEGQVVLKARAAGGDGSVVELDEGSTLENVSIFAPTPTAAQTAGWGLIDIKAGNCEVRRVTIEFDGSWSGIGDVAYPDIFAGIYIYGTAPSHLDDIRIIDVTILNGPKLGLLGGSQAYALYIEYVDNLYIRGFKSTGFEQSCYMDACEYSEIRDFRATDWERYGLNIGSCLYGNIIGGVLLGDGLQTAIAYGVTSTNCDFMLLRDFYLGGGGNTAIDLTSGSSSWVVSGCRGDGAWNTTGFIRLTSGSDNNIVSGNIMNGDVVDNSGSGNEIVHNR